MRSATMKGQHCDMVSNPPKGRMELSHRVHNLVAERPRPCPGSHGQMIRRIIFRLFTDTSSQQSMREDRQVVAATPCRSTFLW